MKKLFYTLAVFLIMGNCFGQKNFNSICFNSFLTTTGNPGVLNQGVFATKDAYKNLKVDNTEKAGTIDIAAVESTITVKCNGEQDIVYKIISINKEEKNQYKTQTVLIPCKDKKGTDFSLIISRDKTGKAANQMNVKIIEANNDGFEYTCSYLKDLFKK